MENNDTPTTDTMICPQCNAEYYAHIEMCKDCEIPLVSPITGLPGDVEMAEAEHDSRFDAPTEKESYNPPQSSVAGTDPIHGSQGLTPEGGVPDSANEDSFDVKYIDSGPMTRLRELSNVLTSSGIQSSIVAGPPGMCSTDKALVVRAEEADKASDVVREYWKRVHPELAEALDNADAGLCPACGHSVGIDAKECSDCGLTLMVVEDEV